jgi:HEPN domain-containing protein
MPLDPVLVSDTRLWFVKAANDLRAAEIDLGAEPPLIEDALFHCQQAAEKALKAFLTFHNVTFRKTHNLEEIGEVCLTIDQSLKDMVDEAVPLTEYAWAFRYPGNILTADSTEVQTALKISRKLFCMILDRLPSETHP